MILKHIKLVFLQIIKIVVLDLKLVSSYKCSIFEKDSIVNVEIA